MKPIRLMESSKVDIVNKIKSIKSTKICADEKLS